MKKREVMAALWLMLAMASACFAQQAGIVGTVTDQTGAVVPGATVTARNLGTDQTRQTVTSASGEYSIPDLNIGVYQVVAEKKGFQRAVVDQVRLEVQSIRSVDLALQVGQVSQEVSVTAGATALQTTESDVGTVVENREVNEIPLNGRNFLQLQGLLPGVTSGRAGTWTVIHVDSQSLDIGGGNFTVNGTRDLYNDYLLDGISFREAITSVNGANPTVDAIQEFRTETSDYSAEFSGSVGGMVNLVTKSGTNAFHGSGFEFVRNEKLDAANFFTNATGGLKTPLKRNQFGGTFGGPIQRNKTFFFASYEAFRERSGSTLIGTYPTPLMRQGDFSELLNLATPRTITDPLTSQPFAGNIINPSSRILSVWPGYLSTYIPLPNQPGILNNYVVTGHHEDNSTEVMARFDHQVSDKLSLSGHYLHSDVGDTPEALNYPRMYTINGNHDENIMAHVAYTKSPTTVLDFRAGYNLFTYSDLSNWSGKTPYIARDVLHINQVTVPDLRASNPPGLGVSEMSGLGCATCGGPRGEITERYQYLFSTYLIRGRHNIRFGATVSRFHDTFPERFIPNGSYSFTGAFTGYGFADMLLGVPASLAASPGIFDVQHRYWNVGPWLQDDFRVTSKLTFNLGVRYDLFQRPVAKHDQQGDIVLPEYAGLASEVLAGPCTVNVGDVKLCQTSLPTAPAATRALYGGSHHDIAPRVGFAYNLGGSGRTVLRGSFGMFFQPEPTNQAEFMTLNPPYDSYYTVYNSTVQQFQNFDFYNPITGQPPGGVQFTYIPQKFPDAYLMSWNLGVQRDLGGGTVLDLRYLGNTDTHMMARTWPNQPPPGPGPVDPRRPYTNVSTVAGDEPIGKSNYNGLQVKVEKRFAHGLSFLSGYTWSKALADSEGAESGAWEATGYSHLQNGHDLRSAWGLFSGDARNRFTLSLLYDLPVGHGKSYLSGANGVVDKLVSGWEVATITTFQSGQPLTAFLNFDNSNTGEGNKLPNRIADANGGPRTVAQFFNINAFVTPAPYTFGNGGQADFQGPGTNDIDLSFIKNTHIKERVNVQFRAELFNFANHLIMGDPNTTLGFGFGQVTSTKIDSREIQLALHIIF
jgi:hypothetical protein